MQWWMMPLPQYDATMAVDNDFVTGMNFSALPTNIHIIQWREGRGELELMGRPQLRTYFDDVAPYAPFFQQFITLTPNISLAQAKKVQIDLIAQLYDTKRQLPYNRVVAAGNFNWEATDSVQTAMAIATLPALLGGTTGTGNTLVGQINAQNATEVTKINGQNAALVAKINGASGDSTSGLVGAINTNIVNPGNELVGHYNGTLGYADTGDAQTINNRLQGNASSLAAPGIGYAGTHYNIPHTGVVFNALSAGASNVTEDPITATPITPGSGPGAATIQWIPIGQANPVTVTVLEMSDIMSGIASRRLTLLTTKTNKTAAVNALTTVAQVAAYNVTTGW